MVNLVNKMILIFKKLTQCNIFLTLKIKEAFVFGSLEDLEEVVGNILRMHVNMERKKSM